MDWPDVRLLACAGDWQRAGMLLVMHDMAELCLTMDVLYQWGEMLLQQNVVIKWFIRWGESLTKGELCHAQHFWVSKVGWHTFFVTSLHIICLNLGCNLNTQITRVTVQCYCDIFSHVWVKMLINIYVYIKIRVNQMFLVLFQIQFQNKFIPK